MILLEDLKDKLRDYGQSDLIDLLDLSTEDLLYYLSDVIEEKYEELVEVLGLKDDEEEV